MSPTAVPLDRRTLVAFLLVAPAAMATLWWLAAESASPEPFLLLALVVPLAVLVVPLALIARRVGSQPDDPEEVEGRLAAALGRSEAEFERWFDSDEPREDEDR